MVMTVLYASYAAGGGQDLIYHNARYWISFYPYWTVLAVVAAVGGFRWMTARARRTVDQSGEDDQPVDDRANTRS